MITYVLTPQYLKCLLRSLNEKINKFESLHEPIKDIDVQGGVPMNFAGSATEV